MTYPIIRLNQLDPKLLKSLGLLRQELMMYHGSDTSPEPFMSFVTQRLSDETMLLILALVEDTPIGYGLAFDVAEHPFMPEWRRSGYITQFFVKGEHRQQGVGQQLFDFIIHWFRQRGISQVLLNVSVENSVAGQFWRKQGFVPQATRMKWEISS